MEETKIDKKSRRLEGVIVSDKMKRTVVVEVTHTRMDPKYQKYYDKKSRFKANVDEDGAYKAGDKVLIEETRPISKDKRWRIVSKIA